MRARLLFWAMAVLATGNAGATEQPWEAMPEGDGRMETYAICSACHSIMLVQQQGMDRARWDDTLDWMVEEQGMPALDPELREKILAYLAMAFSPERPNYQRPSQ